MTEIKFPSIIGITLDGHILVHDSKRRIRQLMNFNSKTGRKSYKAGEYDGPVVRRGMWTVSVDDVPTFGDWIKKEKHG